MVFQFHMKKTLGRENRVASKHMMKRINSLIMKEL